MTLYLGCNPAVFVQLIADCCRRCLRGWLWLKREFCGDFIWLTFEKMCIFVIRFAFVCVCKRERDHSVSCHRKMCSVSCCCIVSCCCKCVQAWGGRGVTGSRSSRLHRFSAAHSSLPIVQINLLLRLAFAATALRACVQFAAVYSITSFHYK